MAPFRGYRFIETALLGRVLPRAELRPTHLHPPNEAGQDERERECDVRDKNGRWFSLRVRPYISLDNKVDGAVLVLVEIDALKRALEFAEAVIETVREPPDRSRRR